MMHSQTAHPVGVYKSRCCHCNLKLTSRPRFRFSHDTAGDTTMIEQTQTRKEESGNTVKTVANRKAKEKRPDKRKGKQGKSIQNNIARKTIQPQLCSHGVPAKYSRSLRCVRNQTG